MTSTSNGNVSGNSEDRRRRKLWLVETYRADRDVVMFLPGVPATFPGKNQLLSCKLGTGEPACRCYRCGTLCIAETVTADRIIPGILGGTYRRNNIRPACGTCNSKTGGKLGASRVKR